MSGKNEEMPETTPPAAPVNTITIFISQPGPAQQPISLSFGDQENIPEAIPNLQQEQIDQILRRMGNMTEMIKKAEKCLGKMEIFYRITDAFVTAVLGIVMAVVILEVVPRVVGAGWDMVRELAREDRGELMVIVD